MRIRWRGLELPTRVVRDEQASKPTYGRFIVEPFERGFGTTIGNSLRRILLSSLEGAAVTHVKIEGVDHEFTTLPGVVEDVTVIILNVKSLIVRLSTDTPKMMRVSVKGKTGESTEVRAAQIEADPAIEIINKDQLIATLTGDTEFKMEMTVSRGRSYATAEENKPEGDQIIGLIPVDSVYSPVTRVRYRVEDTRVGQRTNYDRLIMEIWTNGTITPEMALVEAAKILRKHVNTFVQYFEMGSGLAVDGAQAESEVGGTDGKNVDESVLSMPISSLDLSVRASNCLASAEISTVGMLVQWDEASLLKIRSFGKTSLREIKRKLADLGLSLRSDKTETGTAAGEETAGEEEPLDVRGKAAPMDGYLASPGSPPPASSVDYPAVPPASPAAPEANVPTNKEVGVTGETTG
ncbi:MAG TPA: DNA-directed RNA polymerase subunit alpha [Phycisphaerae bacterium]|nr:DNA-directed RNA polymerase subunit alpha [Phycisphaerae bacterium]